MSHERRQTFRQGVTLIEVLLVVAVLVILASLASPALLKLMESQKLRKSADLLRAKLARARILAMESGRIQMFRYRISGREYSVEPWLAADDAVEGSNSMTFGVAAPTEASVNTDTTSQLSLPDGIAFVGGNTASDTRSLAIEESMAREMSSEADWSPPILFFPDGSSSDAVIGLGNQRNQFIEVTVRGITGLSQVSDISHGEAQ